MVGESGPCAYFWICTMVYDAGIELYGATPTSTSSLPLHAVLPAWDTPVIQIASYTVYQVFGPALYLYSCSVLKRNK